MARNKAVFVTGVDKIAKDVIIDFRSKCKHQKNLVYSCAAFGTVMKCLGARAYARVCDYVLDVRQVRVISLRCACLAGAGL